MAFGWFDMTAVVVLVVEFVEFVEAASGMAFVLSVENRMGHGYRDSIFAGWLVDKVVVCTDAGLSVVILEVRFVECKLGCDFQDNILAVRGSQCMVAG